ncbi:MAG: DUF4347 domain-containing protein [Aureispira sp.]|nr:DUF4347 domain-containing protein [Aureispira sp.]
MNTLSRKPSTRLVVISSNLPSEQLLANAVQPNCGLIVYDYENTTPDSLLNQIQSTLNNSSVDSIAFIDHGEPGEFCLTKNTDVSQEALDKAETGVADFFSGVSQLVAEDGRVDLLACNLYASPDGKKLVKNLEALTNTNFAASDNLTGKNGDWNLESDDVDLMAIYFEPKLLQPWASKYHAQRGGNDE